MCINTPYFIKIVRVESLRTATCLKSVVELNKGMLLIKYFHSNKSSCLYQSNCIEITRLSDRSVKFGCLSFYDITRFKTVVSYVCIYMDTMHMYI